VASGGSQDASRVGRSECDSRSTMPRLGPAARQSSSSSLASHVASRSTAASNSGAASTNSPTRSPSHPRLTSSLPLRAPSYSIARAAYNAREKLIDERTGQIKDYRYIGEAEWTGIFAPDHAPPWAMDRQALWNAVERREDQSTRPDTAQLARDFKIALPFELD